MNFTEIAENRQSCRSYDSSRPVEKEKIDSILAAARLSPSACNGQPYFITVCKKCQLYISVYGFFIVQILFLHYNRFFYIYLLLTPLKTVV